MAETVVCSSDPEQHREALDELARAGFDHAYVLQVGVRSGGFIRFDEQEILSPALAR